MNKNTKRLKVGVVGATGMVGKTFMEILQERNFPIEELRPFASELSLGNSVVLNGESYPIQTLKEGCFKGLDLVFFSSGDEISRHWAPLAVSSGSWAVDNSAAFRMDPDIALIVPEVNGRLLKNMHQPQIIANPNCTTIQLVVVLRSLRDHFGIEDVRVASYQAVSGAGQSAFDELLSQSQTVLNCEEKKKLPTMVPAQPQNFPHPIAFNCIPQIGSFGSNGFTSEEMKVMNETRKILDLPQLKVSAFTVRVPVLNGHAEAVWVTLKRQTTQDQIFEYFKQSEGLIVADQPSTSLYPLQREISGLDPVYVGRIHQDANDPKTWLMWIVGDNIRKGAALNGIQIAERIFDIG